MMTFFLYMLFTLLRIDYPPAVLASDPATQQQLIQTIIHDEYQPSYHIVKTVPPVKQSVFIQPTTLITASSGVVIDEFSGAVLWQRNPEAVLPIASLTKLTTALVFLNTNPDFSKEVTMAKSDETEPDGSRLAVSVGDTLTVGDLFYASLIGSANNATKAMARSTGLSEEQFVSRMNSLVHSLGMEQTTFHEVTGLDPSNTSTVRDYGILVNYALRNSRILDAVTRPDYTFSTINTKHGHRIRNTDILLQDASINVVGAKTGYLDEAGYTFAAQAEQNGHRLTVVLFKSDSSAQRFNEAKALWQWAFAVYKWF